MMYRRSLTVKAEEGLHVGPCYELSRQAKHYLCNITVTTRRGKFNAKSGLQLLEAGMEPGEKVELCCEGVDAEKADAALDGFVMQYFESQ